MSVNLGQIDELRKRAKCSYQEAKEALDKAKEALDQATALRTQERKKQGA